LPELVEALVADLPHLVLQAFGGDFSPHPK
jgi:hypothetical protein